MLIIDTYVKESTISEAGNGLFVSEDNKCGVIFGYLNPNVDIHLSEEEVYSSAELIEKCYYEPKFDKYIYSTDNTVYINHSCENFNFITNDKDENIFIKDMKAGDEILANYCSWCKEERIFTQQMLNKKNCDCAFNKE